MADNDLYVGGGVYVYVPVAPIDYWPVTGVTEPQHLWPFAQTGDYTDQGSTGGLDLTAGGSGNSFDSGLVLNGSGWAEHSHNADVCNLGSTFSILSEIVLAGDSEGIFVNGRVSSLGYTLYFGSISAFQYQIDEAGGGHYISTIPSDYGFAGTFAAEGTLQIVIVYTGGSLYVYVNGVASSSNSYTIDAPSDTTGKFVVGAYDDGTFNFPGTIRRVGILKGTAWSADDVAAIYAGLP